MEQGGGELLSEAPAPPHPHLHPCQLLRARPSPAATELIPSNPTPWPAPPPYSGLQVANGCGQSHQEPRGPAGAAPAVLELGHSEAKACSSATQAQPLIAVPNQAPAGPRRIPHSASSPRGKIVRPGDPGNRHRLWHPESQARGPPSPGIRTLGFYVPASTFYYLRDLGQSGNL